MIAMCRPRLYRYVALYNRPPPTPLLLPSTVASILPVRDAVRAMLTRAAWLPRFDDDYATSMRKTLRLRRRARPPMRRRCAPRAAAAQAAAVYLIRSLYGDGAGKQVYVAGQ